MSRTRQNFPRVHATWQIENTRPRQTAFHRRRGNAEFFLRILAISSNVFLKSSRRSSPLAPWFKGAATFLTLLSEYRHAKHVDRDTFWWLKPLALPSLPYPSISLHRISLSRFLRQWKALVQRARSTQRNFQTATRGFGRHSSDPEPVSSSRETCNAVIVTDSNLNEYGDRLAIFASIRFLVSQTSLIKLNFD